MTGRLVARSNKLHGRSLPERKRKAILQRRGLFNFVSPLTVFLAILSFLQYVAFLFYIARHPFPKFGLFANIAVIAPLYVLSAFGVYRSLYGRKKGGPLETLETHRMYSIKIAANVWVYVCVLTPIFLSLNLANQLLGLETCGPFGLSASLLIMALLFSHLGRSSAPPRQPEADGLGSSPVR